jgi:hypothetical protein
VSNGSTGTLPLAVTSPGPGETVTGTRWVDIWIEAPGGTAPYAFTLSAAGATVWSESVSGLHATLPWETDRTPNGAQTLTVAVRDAAGRTGSTSIPVTVQNAGGPSTLTASFASPASGATVSGSVPVTMNAGGGTPPYTYTLLIDGAQAFAQSSSATSRTHTWNTAGLSSGQHVLDLTVTDAGGQTAQASRTVSVQGGGSTFTAKITSPAEGDVISGTMKVKMSVSGGDPKYRWVLKIGSRTVVSVKTTKASRNYTWNSADWPDGARTLLLTVTDKAGRTATVTRRVTISNGTGPAPLTAAIASPAQNATISGTASVTMTTGGGTPPYGYSLAVGTTQAFSQPSSATSRTYAWDTTGVADGPHVLSLTVTDAGGQTATVTRNVTVDNQAAGSIGLAVTSPQVGETVSDTTWVNIWIEAPYGTPPYDFTLSAAGAIVWTESASGTHVTLPWETFRTPDGARTLTVTVRDAQGRSGSASVNVNVDN